MEIEKMTESQSPRHTPDSNPEEVEDSSHSSRDGSVDVHMQEAVGGVQPSCQPLLIPNHPLFMSYQVSANQCFGEPYGNSLPQLHSAETPHSTSASDGSKSPPPPRQYKPCVVCQDKSSGYHYGVSSCEGCKGFFRRSVTKSMVYECHKANNCVVNKVTRNRCQACRFEKCLAKGMTREAVRNGQHNKKKGKQRPESTSSNNDQLTEDERNLIDAVCLAAATTHQDSGLDSPSAAVRDALRNGEKFQLWEETYELSSRAIVDIVNFAKKVPNFLNFAVADQITLLKASCLEIMVLRLCKSYDAETDEIVLRNFRLNERQINIGGMDSLAPTIFRLAKKMHALNLDEKEFAMVSAICLISGDRSGLTDVQAVEHLRDQLSEALKHYMRQRRSPQCKEFPSVLVNLMDLRSISVQGAERVLDQKKSAEGTGQINPLLVEMLDRKENVRL